jgi:hypothetical protein
MNETRTETARQASSSSIQARIAAATGGRSGRLPLCPEHASAGRYVSASNEVDTAMRSVTLIAESGLATAAITSDHSGSAPDP